MSKIQMSKKNLGSAKHGTNHWWHQRVTAIALTFLCIWFIVSITLLTGAEYQDAYNWLKQPLVTGLSLLTVVFTLYHLNLGLQVIIEDYIHTEITKIITLMLVNFACLIVGLTCCLSILLVFFGGK
ncbi:MAG: succinate dehydrogenase, hydrophobic membrane anchor protein [Rhodospirillaceae bacterium]|nr:succinate dehydrogenase, hydrophobic membrane anchor protein [Rhodospirillaceae bacterium]|tara:strand:+ start:55 stop:432 length:378 start_codon:yes stop_codon:yes gene_type:complete